MEKNKLSPTIFTCLILFTLMAITVHGAQVPVDLGTAGNFVILAKSGISTTGTTIIIGDIGVSPIDSTGITGFGPIMDSSNRFATSSLVSGKLYAADYTPPSPTIMTTAISHMQTAYTDAAGRSNPTATQLGAGNIDGMTLAPGLYTWATGVEIPNGVTLSGGANDVWIFQIGQDLTVGNGAIITLSNGAQAKNIFWQVAGKTTLGTTSDFKGIILSKTSIAMNTGAKLNGRALAQTAVTLDASTVIAPAGSVTTTTSTTSTTTTTMPKVNNPGSNAGSSSDWQCEEWSACNSRDIRTRICTQQNTGTISTETEFCTPMQIDTNSPNENNWETSAQIWQRKEALKNAEYIDSRNQILRARVFANNMKELQVTGVAAQTNLDISAHTDIQGKTKFTAMLRNGQEREIMIMPDTASKNALDMLRVKVCSQDNNCTMQLKDVGSGPAEKIQYEMQLERNSKILGIFQKKMQVSADVDAQTGVTRAYKPWWAFMATQPLE